MIHRISNSIQKITIFFIFNLVIVVVTLLMFEGFSSSLFVGHEIIAKRPLAERIHTKYDEELGWINIPNKFIKDMYGSGKHLWINSQLFRHNKDFSAKVEDDKLRFVCSGDSFTFGYGVDNDHTWCQILTSINPRLETVNMGQGGYGIDQSYLWYKRNSIKIEHDIHIFAFITLDFDRMESGNYLGYGKPVLELRDGILLTKNIPVPKRGFYIPWLTHSLEGIKKLSSFRLLKIFSEKILFKRNQIMLTNKDQESKKMRATVFNVFNELYRINQRKNSTLILVYLPTMSDYIGNTSDVWRKLIDTYVDKEKIIYIDLVEDFRRIFPQEIQKMFIGPGVLDYLWAVGHYSEEGNAYIAKTLYKKLIALPTISNKLRERSNKLVQN